MTARGNCDEELKEDIGDRDYSIQWVGQPDATASVFSQLAVRLLKITKPFLPDPILTEKQVEVKREARFWAEEVEIQHQFQPALALTIRSDISYSGTLEQFYRTHPYRQDPERLLTGLKVRDIEHNSSAVIVKVIESMGKFRETLLAAATGAISRQALEEAPDDQPIVAVRFGRNTTQFKYAMAALRPCVTAENAHQFEVNYGRLLKATKILYQARQDCLKSYKEVASAVLIAYGFQLKQKSINSRDNSELFRLPKIQLKETELLFGKQVKSFQKNILKGGLEKGGVYRRYGKFRDSSNEKIYIASLKLCESPVGSFIQEVQNRLNTYDFESSVPKENKKTISVKNLSGVDARTAVEEVIDELMVMEPDVVLIFLPTSDRDTDEREEESLYACASSHLLRRNIASQAIYEDTLKTVRTKDILNQVIPGILAKLGNLPFVLAEPLEIADYFIGLDVARSTKQRREGTINACASIRLYGRRGEFVRCQLADSTIEGEEIPQRVLERFLPKNQLNHKTILIYRDGRFCGSEVRHLRDKAKAIGAKLILVECYKSGVPRLYNLEGEPKQRVLRAPTKGLALQLSSREVILVTTEVKSERMGLPNPLRLKVIPEEGQEVSLERLVETTLKLTLLHYGSLREPRLPVPLFGADRIAYRRLQGIAPGPLEGDRQFWL
ncbi:MAG: Piwi domain-containing protein [Cyanobacteriota bacterium]|nr:Piwi domain-containing protein [Cyanobacteriota bacterium]